MALVKLRTELERALDDLGSQFAENMDQDHLRSSYTASAETRQLSPPASESDSEKAAARQSYDAATRSVGTCSTAANTPLATALSVSFTPKESRSGETTPPSIPAAQEPASLLRPPKQLGLLPGGTGHFALGTTCLAASAGSIQTLSLEARIEAAKAAEASLEADLLGLETLRAPEQAATETLAAAALARASLQSRGVPGASSSATTEWPGRS
eukprot:TRINITY_DN17515_c0_g1_i1.p1 TRINITY_DN17515_c0_g1~~TRINITY_DN17515_c0_g1_i1.p1  ORF type:complete len:213 (+),score=42.81 TRINITY_DN17515_c0_g1_i1:100-738(+)